MFARATLTATLSALALLACGARAEAQLPTPKPAPWVTKPQDWGQRGIILLPPDRTTGSTLPVQVYPDPKPAPTPPNLNQFQGFNPQGRPVFTNPATGRTVAGNATGLIGAPVTLGEVQRMNAARPPAPIRPRP